MALLVGLILFSLGEALLVTSEIGVSPWTALGQGLANGSELGLGLTTFLISLFVIFFMDPIKRKARIRHRSRCNNYFPIFTLCYSFFTRFRGKFSKINPSYNGSFYYWDWRWYLSYRKFGTWCA